ncbi:hypothetical protein V8E53_004476 [Lactarius tabidus]
MSLSIPFMVGKLIDYTSANPTIWYGFLLAQATAGLLIFTMGSACNTGRTFLMHMPGTTYAATLRQVVEFVEHGEGDPLSQLGIDSSVVGERTFPVDSSVPIQIRALYIFAYHSHNQQALAALRTVQAFNAIPHEKEFSDLASSIFFSSTGWSGNVISLALLGYALAMEHAFSRRLIGLPFDSVWVLHSTRNAQGCYDFKNIMLSYPTRSRVNVLEEFNLEVKVGENVAVVYIISETSKASYLYNYSRRDSRRSGDGKQDNDLVLFIGTIESNIAYGNENTIREQFKAAAHEANCKFVWGLLEGFDMQNNMPYPAGPQRLWAIDWERTVGVKSRGIRFGDAQATGGGVVMAKAQKCTRDAVINCKLIVAPLSWGLVHAASCGAKLGSRVEGSLAPWREFNAAVRRQRERGMLPPQTPLHTMLAPTNSELPWGDGWVTSGLRAVFHKGKVVVRGKEGMILQALTVGRLSLSGSQHQHLAIARVLLKKPAILVLDEVTSSLVASAERHRDIGTLALSTSQ